MVRHRLPGLALVPYRNLELLSEHNVILKLSGGPKMRFDGNAQQHYHIRCIECDCVDDVLFKPLQDLERIFDRQQTSMCLATGWNSSVYAHDANS